MYVCDFRAAVDSRMSKINVLDFFFYCCLLVFFFYALGIAFSFQDSANNFAPYLACPMSAQQDKEAAPGMGRPGQTNLSETVNPSGRH